ncbi:OLC1v1016574C2 [Oldenlandia corymbosa var. corymbosa]|nr:OLC1v1016574C2 [Oldenlandia corymbosa var. corymbosa]
MKFDYYPAIYNNQPWNQKKKKKAVASQVEAAGSFLNAACDEIANDESSLVEEADVNQDSSWCNEQSILSAIDKDAVHDFSSHEDYVFEEETQCCRPLETGDERLFLHRGECFLLARVHDCWGRNAVDWSMPPIYDVYQEDDVTGITYFLPFDGVYVNRVEADFCNAPLVDFSSHTEAMTVDLVDNEYTTAGKSIMERATNSFFGVHHLQIGASCGSTFGCDDTIINSSNLDFSYHDGGREDSEVDDSNYGDDDYDYLQMQAQFDNVDLPLGVEASFSWLQSSAASLDSITSLNMVAQVDVTISCAAPSISCVDSALPLTMISMGYSFPFSALSLCHEVSKSFSQIHDFPIMQHGDLFPLLSDHDASH